MAGKARYTYYTIKNKLSLTKYGRPCIKIMKIQDGPGSEITPYVYLALKKVRKVLKADKYSSRNNLWQET